MASGGETDDGFERTREGPRINPRLVLAALGVGVLLLFIFQNTERATVEFAVWDWRLPLSVLILVTVVVTLLVAGLVAWFVARRAQKAEKGGRSAR